VFPLLLEGAAAQGVGRVDRLLARVGAAEFDSELPVALSAGVAVFPGHGSDVAELERCADGALYWAKREGKNRSCLYDPSVVRPLSAEELAQRAAREARLQAAEEFIRVVDAKDTYTGQHSLSVSMLAEAIASRLGLEEDVVAQVRLAGLLHDLGKIALPDTLLSKPGPLDLHELRLMRTHPELGQALLTGLGLEPVDTWILHHHEHWDGSGYPLGLQQDEIPIGSRIILVADAFDAIVSERSYRGARSVGEALAEIRALAGKQFDPQVVSAFEAHLGLLVADEREEPVRIGLVA
jgi:putative nucleotidyltransferase with HDIG domain